MKKTTNKVSRNFEEFLKDLNIQLSQVQYFDEDGEYLICITESEFIWGNGKKAGIRKEDEEVSREYIIETEEGSTIRRAFRQYDIRRKGGKSIIVDDMAPVIIYKVQRSARA